MNNKDQTSLVITTINKPNNVINKYLDMSKKNNVQYIIIGDKKSPPYKKNILFLI